MNLGSSDPSECCHPSTTSEVSSGSAATLIVDVCNDCGIKVSSEIIPHDKT